MSGRVFGLVNLPGINEVEPEQLWELAEEWPAVLFFLGAVTGVAKVDEQGVHAYLPGGTAEVDPEIYGPEVRQRLWGRWLAAWPTVVHKTIDAAALQRLCTVCGHWRLQMADGSRMLEQHVPLGPDGIEVAPEPCPECKDWSHAA